jgi:hypothetical protein
MIQHVDVTMFSMVSGDPRSAPFGTETTVILPTRTHVLHFHASRGMDRSVCTLTRVACGEQTEVVANMYVQDAGS